MFDANFILPFVWEFIETIYLVEAAKITWQFHCNFGVAGQSGYGSRGPYSYQHKVGRFQQCIP